MMTRSVVIAIAFASGCGAAAPGPTLSTVETTSVSVQPPAYERSESAIRDAMKDHAHELRQRCGAITREIDRYETTLHLEIADSGRVEIARARGNHPIVDACVSDLARTWTFGRASDRTVTDVTFTMSR